MGKSAQGAARNFYESYVATCSASIAEDRLSKVIARIPRSTQSLLDIGCGLGRNLRLFQERLPAARLCGIDVAESAAEQVREQGFEATACDASSVIPYDDKSFDVVVCGEVLEHVVDTDRLLEEIHRVLIPDGTLILTTPNLAYAFNRVLLAFGIQPLFTETSLRKNLGRGLKLLGQGNSTQGHLKLFTAPALRDILRETCFEIHSFQGYRWLYSGAGGKIDAAIARFPDLAAGFVVEARPVAQMVSTPMSNKATLKQ